MIDLSIQKDINNNRKFVAAVSSDALRPSSHPICPRSGLVPHSHRRNVPDQEFLPGELINFVILNDFKPFTFDVLYIMCIMCGEQWYWKVLLPNED